MGDRGGRLGHGFQGGDPDFTGLDGAAAQAFGAVGIADLQVREAAAQAAQPRNDRRPGPYISAKRNSASALGTPRRRTSARLSRAVVSKSRSEGKAAKTVSH